MICTFYFCKSNYMCSAKERGGESKCCSTAPQFGLADPSLVPPPYMTISYGRSQGINSLNMRQRCHKCTPLQCTHHFYSGMQTPTGQHFDFFCRVKINQSPQKLVFASVCISQGIEFFLLFPYCASLVWSQQGCELKSGDLNLSCKNVLFFC